MKHPLTHVVCMGHVITYWRERAMQDGYTLHATKVDAEPVPGGYLPAFTGYDGTRIICRMATPLPTDTDARNSLRNVLWAAHVAGRISLMQHPLEAKEAA